MDKDSAIFLAGLVMVFALLVGLTNVFSMWACSMYGNDTDRETKYKFIGGCYVKTEKGWRSKKELRIED